jgi:hypothetical protein
MLAGRTLLLPDVIFCYLALPSICSLSALHLLAIKVDILPVNKVYLL